MNNTGLLHVTSRTADGSPTGLAAIDQELDRLRAKLADLSAHYTDQYPGGRESERTNRQDRKDERPISSPSRRLQAEWKTGRRCRSSDAIPKLDAAAAIAEPTASQPGGDHKSGAGYRRAQSQSQQLPGSFERRATAREQQLADLTRGYDQSKANYDDLLKKKNESEMATSMEQMQQGERFTMLDPPSLPPSRIFRTASSFVESDLASVWR